jgi:putative membrane protein
MPRHLLIGAATAFAALSLAACNQKPAEPQSAATPMEKAETPSANPATTIPTPANEAAAPDFVSKAAASDMFEIEAAKLAGTRSSNADVKAFAKMMIHDHTESTAGLKKAIVDAKLNLTPPPALPSDLQDKIDKLNQADAKDFDKTYLDQQVDAHQAALDLFQRYAQDGDSENMKTFAAKVAPTIQQHLDKAKSLRDALK